MASYNKVMLMGNVTRDIELRHTPNNQAVATIGIAVNRRYRTADGQQKEEVTFVDCDAWGKTAETMSKYLSKGRPVFIEGHLRLDQWKDQEGNNRSKLKVVIENFQFIDSKGGGGGGGGGNAEDGGGAASARSGSAARSAPNPSGGGYEPIQEDDIPF
ncbi:MAG: single-stranded DNA-binding protein [Phycisphaeraceae bacterium]|nr:single-stranded DNA-binding protein [Phycisphaeraceae bacterium]